MHNCRSRVKGSYRQGEEFVCGPRQADRTRRQIQMDLIVFGSGQRSGAVVSAVAVDVSMNSSFSVWLLVQPGPVLHYRNLVTLNA